MTLQPILHADFAIQLHVATAVAAVFIGAFVLWRRKGTRLHKALGRIWVVLMLVTATSALFIHEIRLIGPFSPIHLFSLFTYVTLFNGLKAIIVDRDSRRHRAEMQGLYAGALMLAGAFTFLPGRRMHLMLFGPDAGWAHSLMVLVPVLAGALFLWLNLRRRALVPLLSSRN
ncbi:Uncharacterized membrane protein [Devosia lucknowensis]|uniref:Uncharacterized membrane protein n=1 Tax=Devosia lucknowensis TaxID=1096929 RepID=A0A1Y6G8H3_9HYPH|nr:DUF2306 domain-containing protein [Devosia lucknowensis]SMQ85633.1 Uncharacterized membrane protein [Devosia lucknowensis]